MSRSKKDYRWYKEHGICIQCGSENAEIGRVRCGECLAKNAESALRRRKSGGHIEHNRQEYMSKMRQSRKEQGLCIWCGKPKSQYSTCFCIDCRIKNQKRNVAKKIGFSRSERPTYGLCYRCGKKIEQGKLCEICKKQSVENLPKSNERWVEFQKRQNKLIFESR